MQGHSDNLNEDDRWRVNFCAPRKGVQIAAMGGRISTIGGCGRASSTNRGGNFNGTRCGRNCSTRFAKINVMQPKQCSSAKVAFCDMSDEPSNVPVSTCTATIETGALRQWTLCAKPTAKSATAHKTATSRTDTELRIVDIRVPIVLVNIRLVPRCNYITFGQISVHPRPV